MKNTKYHSSMIKPPKTKAEFIALMDLAIYVLDEIHNDLHEIGEILESQHSKKEQSLPIALLNNEFILSTV